MLRLIVLALFEPKTMNSECLENRRRGGAEICISGERPNPFSAEPVHIQIVCGDSTTANLSEGALYFPNAVQYKIVYSNANPNLIVEGLEWRVKVDERNNLSIWENRFSGCSPAFWMTPRG
jgi:hypothetical protein